MCDAYVNVEHLAHESAVTWRSRNLPDPDVDVDDDNNDDDGKEGDQGNAQQHSTPKQRVYAPMHYKCSHITSAPQKLP